MGKSSLSVGTKAWADKINAILRRGAFDWTAACVEAGHVLLKAKKECAHGDFLNMVKTELDIEPRTAERLMRVAAHPVLGNAQNFARLPAAFDALYRLTELPASDVETLMDAGSLNAGMRIQDVIELLPPKQTKARDANLGKVTDADYEDIMESADEADTPEHTGNAVPGGAVPDPLNIQSEYHAADDREGGDSGHQLEVAAGVLSMLDRVASVFDNEPSSPSAVAVAMASAERLKFLLVELHRFVEEECDTEQMAREYDGDFTPGKIAAGLNWLYDFYAEFVKIEEGRAAAE